MVIFFVNQNHKKKGLSEILDVKKIEQVDMPIEVANGLQNESYISEDYLKRERDMIFSN